MNKKEFIQHLIDNKATKQEIKVALEGAQRKEMPLESALTNFKQYKSGKLIQKATKMAEQRPQILGKLRREARDEMSPRERMGVGVGKWAASTPGLKQVYEAVSGQEIAPSDFESYRETAGGWEKAGEVIPDIAALMTGGGIASKSKYIKDLPRMAKYGLGGAGSVGLHQTQNIQSGRGIDPVEAGVEMGFSLAPSALKWGTKGFRKGSELVAEEVGKVPLEGLEMWSTKQGRKTLKSLWRKELPVADEMVGKVFNAKNSLPESKVVNKVLSDMPRINTAPVVQEIDNAINKVSLKSVNKPMISKLNTLKKDFELSQKALPDIINTGDASMMPITIQPSRKAIGKWEVVTKWKDPRKLGVEDVGLPKYFDSKTAAMEEYARRGYKMPKSEIPTMSAHQLRNKRIELDDIIDWNKPGASKLNELLKGVRGRTAQLLEMNAPPQYKPLMQSYSSKLNTIGNMKRIIGNDKTAARQKAFTMLRTVDNDTRQPVKEILKDFDTTFGTDYTQKAELMHIARMLGKAGKENLETPLLPKTATGNRWLAMFTAGLGFPKMSPYLLKGARGMDKGLDWTGRQLSRPGLNDYTLGGLGLQTGRSTYAGRQ